MSYLLDTNVVSELRRVRPHGAVLHWLSTIDPDDLFVSAVTFGELQAGVEKLRSRDRAKAEDIERWLEQELIVRVVLPMDAACFRQWAKLMGGRSPGLVQDAMIAATALVHDLVVVTRNTKDFVDFGVGFLDPFSSR